jgi:dTDP-4-dehydrorhamnose 3,5-epimerase
VHGDARGFFYESFHAGKYRQLGIDVHFVQSHVSRSGRGVLRGLHYQWPHPQGKLVTVLEGEVYDVAVDIRRGSRTFGRWEAAMLTAENHRQLWIPEGFAHGFCVVSEAATFMYQCTALYDPAADAGVRWNDAAIGIDWPVAEPLLSAKDEASPFLADVPADKLPVFEET